MTLHSNEAAFRARARLKARARRRATFPAWRALVWLMTAVLAVLAAAGPAAAGQ